ncbi:MAG TPA: S41 family peptidase [Candidatus Saccharimonadales bacterium]|nr:S41 family peptidase [Candidatus Saccharimonadales bacterium]
MDTDRTPTEPITDHEPPIVTSLTNGPSQAPTSPAAGRGRRAAIIGAVVGLALVATFSAGIGVGQLISPSQGAAAGQTPNPASSPGTTQFALIQEAWDTLHREYVGRDTLDERALIYGAIDGMTQAVGDTGHTDFMTPEERAARNDALSGSYVGIGVRIDETDDGLPRIVAVFKDSPAAAAGIEVDDVIVDVDGKATTGKSLDEVAGWVRGEAGSTVKVTVRADGTGPERALDIVRADVPIEAVSWTLVPGTTTALIRLEQFSSGAADDMVQALKDAKGAGAERLVLDLRGNPGGYVNEAVGVASQFLTGGLVYVERDAQGNETKHEVSPDGVATDIPLVVLVDGNTASSSEIVSGALQDAGRAEIIGETTYGTGTVLGEFSLSDGSALRVGTVEWLTPSGRRIWHEGIAPDVAVTLPDDATPLTPDDVSRLTEGQLGTSTDAPLRKALETVASEALAAS